MFSIQVMYVILGISFCLWLCIEVPLSLKNRAGGDEAAGRDQNTLSAIWATLVLVIQYVSGLFLTMLYKPDAGLAFASIDRIMREVRWGWLIRYAHTTGASLFFVVLYLHLFRGLLYGSYRRPRELYAAACRARRCNQTGSSGLEWCRLRFFPDGRCRSSADDTDACVFRPLPSCSSPTQRSPSRLWFHAIHRLR